MKPSTLDANTNVTIPACTLKRDEGISTNFNDESRF